MSVYYPVLANRRQKWEILMKNTDLSKKTNKLKRYIRKGIPGPFRSEVWMKTSGAYLSQKKQPQLYQKLLKTQYEADIVETIKIDLPRTFPENIRFPEIERKLFNVLVAYAHYNKDIGYCQGLNYIAGLILIITKNEETTFWLLREMVENIVPNYHTKTMSGLIVDIDVLSELVKIKVPYCYDHIQNMGLPWAVIATKWFICLYAEVLPIETVLRIWDCLFMEGSKVSLNFFISQIVCSQFCFLLPDTFPCWSISSDSSAVRNFEM